METPAQTRTGMGTRAYANEGGVRSAHACDRTPTCISRPETPTRSPIHRRTDTPATCNLMRQLMVQRDD
eukprot:13283718-Alexandrium_andersonii.AAC.1